MSVIDFRVRSKVSVLTRDARRSGKRQRLLLKIEDDLPHGLAQQKEPRDTAGQFVGFARPRADHLRISLQQRIERQALWFNCQLDMERNQNQEEIPIQWFFQRTI